jgi:hypothetical protein
MFLFDSRYTYKLYKSKKYKRIEMNRIEIK